jgi:spore germination cell wall hydrolase CwlJ-like protein
LITRPLVPLLLLTAVLLTACATYYVPRDHGRAAGLARIGAGYGHLALARITSGMDPAMLALARRHDTGRRQDYWGRVRGWEVIDIAELPTLGFRGLSFDDARRINSYIPIADVPAAAPPFVLNASLEDRARAFDCLTQAVYFEAGFEPADGKRAVAQVVLNRLRHPGYPKTVCGVIYQGSQRATGCQFSFTCDGSLLRPRNAAAWANAQIVAREALNGHVEPAVGTSTHYHADYVSPYWAPTLVKLATAGVHIFYRWTGPLGDPEALNGRYRGGEANLGDDILQGDDARTPDLPQGVESAPPPRVVQFDQGDGVMRSYVIADSPADPTGLLAPVSPGLGVLTPTRRRPTPAEVRAINEALARLPEAQTQPSAGDAQ